MNDITRETNGQANGKQQQQKQTNPTVNEKNWQLAQPQTLTQGSHEIANLLN